MKGDCGEGGGSERGDKGDGGADGSNGADGAALGDDVDEGDGIRDNLYRWLKYEYFKQLLLL